MIKKLIPLVVAVLVAPGCAKKVKTSYLDEPRDPNGADKLVNKDDAALNKLLTECTLHFGFDDSSLTESDQTTLAKVAAALRVRPWVAIRIAGHTDERGTEEYNMALGMRRADAARQYLVALGVSEDQVATISFGEEQPAKEGADEDAWALNRRDELGVAPLEMFGYLGQPVEVLK